MRAMVEKKARKNKTFLEIKVMGERTAPLKNS